MLLLLCYVMLCLLPLSLIFFFCVDNDNETFVGLFTFFYYSPNNIIIVFINRIETNNVNGESFVIIIIFMVIVWQWGFVMLFDCVFIILLLSFLFVVFLNGYSFLPIVVQQKDKNCH